MLSRKLFAAVLTTIICYFLIPFFFNDFSSNYFLIGLAVSTITVPILFVVGILSSIAIEVLSKQQHFLLSYVKHLGCGIICALIVLFIAEGSMDSSFFYLLIAITYVTVFFANDYTIKYVENKHT